LSLFHIDAGREWRGGQRQSYLLVRELYRQGWPVTFVVQPRSPLLEKAAAAGLPVLPRRMRSELGFVAALRLAIAMRRRKCQLVHFHDAHAAAVGGMAAALAQVPLRVISRRVDFPLGRNFLSRRKYIKAADAVIAISQGVKRVLVEGGVAPERVEVVPSGIDFSVYDQDLPRDYLRREFHFSEADYLVGIVAQLEDHKGHRYLIEAAHLLMQKTRNVKIVIVGEGSLRLELSQQAERLEVKDVVYFIGFRTDIPRILASLDLFVLSSHLEGLGSSLLDAMACGLPVVATRTGGIPEVVHHGKTGLLVSAKNPEALAEAILTLYHDRRLAARLAEEGRRQVRGKFSAQATAARTVEVYLTLAARKGLRLETGREPGSSPPRLKG
jgi:glycosyltransferase involved in cell wall biosynthesis